MARPKRHPVNEIVNLYNLTFDLGILHYASDTPLGKGKNLGAGTLSYFGMDSTYAANTAILRRIFMLEKAASEGERCMNKQQVIDKVEKAWTDFHQSYAGLTPEQMIQPGVDGVWSVRDLLAHVSWWEDELLIHLPEILAGNSSAALFGALRRD